MTTETAYPFTTGQFNDLTDEQREAVEAVAEFLTGYTVSEGTDLSDVEITRALNLLTPSEGCVPAEELDPDILEAIHKKFNAVFSVGTELADMELIKQGFEPFKHFSFCPIIEPGYDDASHIVIVDYQDPICYLHEWHKAWDFHFGSLQDLADAVLNVKHHLIKQVVLRHPKEDKPQPNIQQVSEMLRDFADVVEAHLVHGDVDLPHWIAEARLIVAQVNGDAAEAEHQKANIAPAH